MKVRNIREFFLGLPYDIDFDLKVCETLGAECVLISYDQKLIEIFLKRNDIFLKTDLVSTFIE